MNGFAEKLKKTLDRKYPSSFMVSCRVERMDGRFATNIPVDGNITSDMIENIADILGGLGSGYSAVKSFLRLHLCKAEEEDSLLRAGVPCEPFLDMLAIPVIAMEMGRIKVTEGLAKQWGIGNEELFHTCRGQTEADNYRLSTMHEITRGILGPEAGMDMCVIQGGSGGAYGANALFCNEALDKACGMLGEDSIFLLPSSIHEVFAVPYEDGLAAFLAETVGSVNEEHVSPEKRLSNSVYTYHKGGILEMAETPKRAM